ncbi:hypothetical protein ACFLZP_03735 [Patescibacteria group bacterium]
MKKLVLLLSFFWLLFSGPVVAQETPNNLFGIHLASPAQEDLEDAAALVNSSGGDWGYVTLVIAENDRDLQKWQDAFDRMRELHLIPIVRLATSPDGTSGWRRPDPKDASQWAKFLDRLNWPVKKRIIIFFNEPNHSAEWGGKVDPAHFAQVVLEYAQVFKEQNNNFFLMMAGLDAAAPSQPPNFEDEQVFLKLMDESLSEGLPGLFENLDGWTSHSYPNHGFRGGPWDTGRNSLQTYLWELKLLKSFGVEKDLPVYITETGWPHREGITAKQSFLSAKSVSQNMSIMFSRYQDDPQIQAVTPFILNYQDDLFAHFSWRLPDHQQEFYPQYQKVQSLPKKAGRPEQEQNLKVFLKLPEKLITSSEYKFYLPIKNEGQAIWDQEEGYYLDLVNPPEEFEYFFSPLISFEPGKRTSIKFFLKTSDQVGSYLFQIGVAREGEIISNLWSWSLELFPELKLKIKASLFPGFKVPKDDFRLLVYDSSERVVWEEKNLQVQKDGWITVQGLKNLALGESYRLVLIKPYFLPRQTFLTIQEQGNKATFKTFWKLDYDLDGRFSWGDVRALFNF